jgi:hypothetical protein
MVIASTIIIEIEEVILEELLIIIEEVDKITTKIKKGVMKMIFLKVQQSQEITEDVMIDVVVIMLTKPHGSKKIPRKK